MARYQQLSKRWMSDQHGASAVEFALLMPLYLLMLLGMMAYGIYFGAAHSIQQLAADAARVAVAGITPDERVALVNTYIESHGSSYILIDRERLNIEPEQDQFDPGQFRLTLRYDASDLPIWNLYPPLPMPSPSIVYRSTIRNGGY